MSAVRARATTAVRVGLLTPAVVLSGRPENVRQI